MIRDYQLSIPAGGSVTQQATGSYIALMRSSMDTQIIRFECIGQSGEVVANVGLFQGEKIPQTGKPFTSVRLTNPGASDVVVTIIAGDGAYQSDRLSGVVSVQGTVIVDPVPSRVFPEFVAGTALGATAGEFQNIVLSNPAGSGKKLFCSTLRASLPAKGSLLRCAYISDVTGWQSMTRGHSKRRDAVASVGVVKRLSTPKYVSVSEFYYQYAAVNETKEISPKQPFVIAEGEALGFFISTVTATGMGASFEWEERNV